MDLNAVGCFFPIFLFFYLWWEFENHQADLALRLKQIQDGDFSSRQVPEGEALPHDMYALMWADL